MDRLWNMVSWFIQSAQSAFKTDHDPSRDELFNKFLAESKLERFEYGDFSDIKYLNQGGFGVCYSGYHREKKCVMALKFFGYTNKEPYNAWIRSELKMDYELNELNCVAKLYGYFIDTKDGYVNHISRTNSSGSVETGKRFKQPYLVKVSECLRIDIFTALISREFKRFTEKDASILFHNLLLHVNELHSKQFIHRDLKLENIMLIEGGKPFDIKLIDFGLACKLGPDESIECSRLYGSREYIAPESVGTHGFHKYSRKSDIWQCGVVLYILLCTTTPFKDQNALLLAKYSTQTKAFENLSDEVKNLFQLIFRRDPRDRPTAARVLRHPWIIANTHDRRNLLTKDYLESIKSWKYCKQLRNKFDTRMGLCRDLKQQVIEYLSQNGYDAGSLQITKDGFYELRSYFLDEIHQQGAVDTCDKVGVDFSAYCRILNKCKLEKFADQNIFNLFDTDRNGSVDYCEFLLLLASFLPDQDDPRLLFDLCDRDNSKTICRNEFHHLIVHLLDDHHLLESDEIFSAFDTVDKNKNGVITFREFEDFYNAIMHSSVSATIVDKRHRELADVSSDPKKRSRTEK